MRAPNFWYKEGVLPTLLSPMSQIWAWRARRRLTKVKPTKVDIPVICIGNVVAGGAGKTPVALSVMERLHTSNINAGFLSRGYGGSISASTKVETSKHSSRDVGDEPLLLASVAPTWIGNDRVKSALAAVDTGIGAIVMDDGLQNPALHKDLSILVIDGRYGYGNGRVMPAGPLREPLECAMQRVEAIALIGDVSDPLQAAMPKNIPILMARFVPATKDDDISGKPVVAFAGIGQPEKFFETLAGMGCDLIDIAGFPDHYYYSVDEIMRLIDTAAMADALVVTTEKDMVRVPVEARDMIRSLKIRLDWNDLGELDEVLGQVLKEKV
ncbi:MAG: Tetraacyldisaccharide 4'-kinase [Alphaproteobacteria bacterium MarineAlpha11_Bin1]|nr:MAG: Tetraacyldisaccharide 4'-kinase [Alphaproteobacteria bacterium MarineAlpha11_Bin1]|tara:strand:- start:4417 stop:5394 length:978 start_codon:yes stop_codon:yes gene_type:complete